MPESSIVVQPEPMDSGTYTAASRLQAAGLQSAIAVFEECAAAVPIPAPPQPIVIADYGAASGHNSLLPIGAAIAGVLYAGITVGAVNGLQIVLGVPREIGSTVLALMIVLIAVQAPLLTRLERWIDRRRANRRHDAAAELTVEKGTA